MKLFPSFRRRKPGFAETMIASFPPSLPPPDPLVLYFRWLESVGADRTQAEMRFALIDPDQSDFSMFVEPVDPAYTSTWIGESDPLLCERFAAFVRTGGDGSYAALWRDDAGRMKFVHLGSGSGSTLLCTLTEDPIDFLRLLAIGYDELCWPEAFNQTPEEVHAARAVEFDDVPAFIPRHHMRAWVEATFGVTVPNAASEIVKNTADMDQDTSNDPFWRWIRRLPSWDR